MRRPRGGVCGAVGFATVAAPPESAGLAGGFCRREPVDHAITVRLPSSGPDGDSFGVSDRPPYSASRALAGSDRSTDVATDCGTHSQADGKADPAALTTSDADTDPDATQPPRHTRIQDRFRGGVDIRYGRSCR